MTGGVTFSNAEHLQTLGEERHDGKKDKEAAYETKLKGLVLNHKGNNMSLIICSKSTGTWLSVHSYTVSGPVLYVKEFWDFLCSRYNISPIDLQSQCGRYGTGFGVTHKFSCSTVGLVIVRHNEIRDKLLYFYRRTFTSESVCAEPLIHQGHTRFEQEIRQGSEKYKERRGDVKV